MPIPWDYSCIGGALAGRAVTKPRRSSVPKGVNILSPASRSTLSALRTRALRASILSSVLLSVLAFLAAAGCWGGYIADVALGELGVLLNSRPITDVLDANTLDPNTAAKLRYVLDVRAFATDTLGLNGGQAYTTFYDSNDSPVVYNVSACRKDRFEPYTWCFPIVGCIEYLGFFNKDMADDCAQRLEDDGYDVFMYPPIGYSTLGWFADPLFSEALGGDAIDLADLVMHELTHNTVYKASDSQFSESIATFVGRTGTLAYLADRYGSNQEIQEIARNRWADADLYNQFWIALYQALDALYSRQDLTSDEKIARREPIFADFIQKFQTDYLPAFHYPEYYAGLPNVKLDNAYVMINRRYNLDLDLFQSVYDKLGQDLPAAIQVFVASVGSADPKQYLRDWLAAHP
jgi:predicted aminopeptidase